MGDPENTQYQEQANVGKTRPIFRVRWIMLAVVPISLAVIPIGFAVLITTLSLRSDWNAVVKAGIVQPALAALIALAVVLSMRLVLGRYSNDRRKGSISASSATIAVKLWALCFALLFGSMILASVVNTWFDGTPAKSDASVKSVETQLEVKTNGSAPAVAKAKVVR